MAIISSDDGGYTSAWATPISDTLVLHDLPPCWTAKDLLAEFAEFQPTRAYFVAGQSARVQFQDVPAAFRALCYVRQLSSSRHPPHSPSAALSLSFRGRGDWYIERQGGACKERDSVNIRNYVVINVNERDLDTAHDAVRKALVHLR